MLAEAHAVEPPDDPIAVLIQQGNYREALSQCSETHAALLGRLCMALLGSQSDAEEVVQETLLAAHRAMPSYRGEGSVRAWLCGIARRQCARHMERQTRHKRHLHLVPEPQEQGSPESSMADKRRAQTVRAALARLKPSEREALVLRYQAELSFREIGLLCSIDEAAARKRASRGLKALRSLITPEVVE
jgi:RNA polymerase sigma-70 factor (ECF subfamily)